MSDFWIRRIPKERLDSSVPFALVQVTGTRGWMAPELYHQQKYNFPSDVYCLGLNFAFVFCGGSHPYGEDEEKRNFVMKNQGQIVFNVEKKLRSLFPGLFELVESMLNFDQSRRPSSVMVLKHTIFHQMVKASRPPPSIINNVPTGKLNELLK